LVISFKVPRRPVTIGGKEITMLKFFYTTRHLEEHPLAPTQLLEYIGLEDDDDGFNRRQAHEAAAHGKSINGFKLGYSEQLDYPGHLTVTYTAWEGQ
jgi:hypothetical protein